MLLGIYPIYLRTAFTQKPAHKCSEQLYSSLPKCGHNQGVPKGEQISEWTHEHWHFLAKDYYSAIKGNERSSLKGTFRNFKCTLLSQRSRLEKAIRAIWSQWYELLGKVNNVGKMSVVARRRKGWIGGTKKAFRTVKLFCMKQYMDTCHYTFVKAHGLFNTKSEP